jgi:molybdenum cofactor cytidylyltransferase
MYHGRFMIPGVILAAGASSRMGRPKALLPAGGASFLRRLVETLRIGGISRIAVVIRPEALDVAAEALASGAEPVINLHPDEGQLSSLVAGLSAVESETTTAALVTLVDVPLIRPETIATLLSRVPQADAPIVRAAYQGRHGHPVIYSRAIFDALRAGDRDAGAKSVMRAYNVEDVSVDDPAVVEDVDTPEDYQRLFSAPPVSPRR